MNFNILPKSSIINNIRLIKNILKVILEYLTIYMVVSNKINYRYLLEKHSNIKEYFEM